MEIARGAVVRSSAGRDKGTFLIIMDCDRSYAYVCDGKKRPLDRLKKKKIKHLCVTNTKVQEAELSTNRLIRKALRLFQEKPDKQESSEKGGSYFV